MDDAGWAILWMVGAISALVSEHAYGSSATAPMHTRGQVLNLIMPCNDSTKKCTLDGFPETQQSAQQAWYTTNLFGTETKMGIQTNNTNLKHDVGLSYKCKQPTYYPYYDYYAYEIQHK